MVGKPLIFRWRGNVGLDEIGEMIQHLSAPWVLPTPPISGKHAVVPTVPKVILTIVLNYVALLLSPTIKVDELLKLTN